MRNPRLLLRLALSLALLALLSQLLEGQRLADTLRHVSLWPVILAASGEWIFYAIESVRLRLMFRHAYSWLVLFRSRLLSVLVGNFLPGNSSAELVRLFLLDAHQPGHKMRIGTILIANRVYGLLALAVIFALMLALWPSTMPGIRPAQATMLAALLLSAVVLVLVLPSNRRLRLLGARLLRKWPTGRFKRLLRKLYLALSPLSSWRVWPLALTTAVGTTLICVLQFWLLGQAVGINESFGFWAMVVPLVALASFLPLGIGVIGPQDISLITIVAYHGRPVEPFVIISLLIHSIRILGSLLGLCFLSDADHLLSLYAHQPRLKKVLGCFARRRDSKKLSIKGQ